MIYTHGRVIGKTKRSKIDIFGGIGSQPQLTSTTLQNSCTYIYIQGPSFSLSPLNNSSGTYHFTLFPVFIFLYFKTLTYFLFSKTFFLSVIISAGKNGSLWRRRTSEAYLRIDSGGPASIEASSR